MLRFLSNYLFQNENQERTEDPTTIPERDDVDQGPKAGRDSSSADFMDFTEDNDERPDDDDDDDWVLIGSKACKQEEEQEVALVAPDDEEEAGDDQQGCDEKEEPEEEQEGLLWENKLIEHPSMSVYIDLATSLNGVSSCPSLSSIASPEASVIVLEDDEEDMEIVEPEMEGKQHSDIENQTATPAKKSNPPPVQNGRRKKGHYPCSSSNSGNLPRRYLRNGAPRNGATLQLANSILDTISSEPNQDVSASKKKRPNTGNSTPAPCGIAVVGQGPALTHQPNLVSKNLKMAELFPTPKGRRGSPPKNSSTAKGHFLQETRRRSEVQNYTKHSHVNNDRRSAQQRRVQKGATGAPAPGRK